MKRHQDGQELIGELRRIEAQYKFQREKVTELVGVAQRLEDHNQKLWSTCNSLTDHLINSNENLKRITAVLEKVMQRGS